MSSVFVQQGKVRTVECISDYYKLDEEGQKFDVG